MKKGFVIIPFDISWSWSTDYTIQTAKILSRKYTVLCLLLEDSFSAKEYFVLKKKPELFKKHSKNFYIYRPLQIIPFRRFKVIHNLNIFLNLLLVKAILSLANLTTETKDKFLWVFHPKLYPLTKLFGKGYKLIYDCVDFYDFGLKGEERERLKEYERKLTKEAFVVTANSKVLFDHLKKTRKDVHLVPQGFRIKHFKEFKKRKRKSPTKIVVDKNKPTIGLVGGINHRLDFNLLKNLIDNNPRWNFVLWGPIQKPRKKGAFPKNLDYLISRKNVIYGVSDKKEEIPAIIDKFDIGIIPYDVSQDFNKYCYPMKIFEYFYMGKPVVSTPIEELKRFPKLVKIGRDANEWEKHIKTLLSKPWPEQHRKEQKRLARENSWKNKVDTMLSSLC